MEQFDHRIRGIERAGRGQRVDRRYETVLPIGACAQRDLPPEMAVGGFVVAEGFDLDNQPERTVEQRNPRPASSSQVVSVASGWSAVSVNSQR